MNEPMRPMTLGEILDRTVQFYRSRFWVFLGISVIPTGIVLILASAAVFFIVWWQANGAGTASQVVAGIIAIIFVAAIGLIALPITLVVTALAAAAMNHAVATAYHGEKITIRGAYKAIWRRGWRYIWLYLLEALIVWVAPAVVWTVLVLVAAGIAAVAASNGVGSAAATLVGGLAFVVVAAVIGYAVWMLLRFCLAFPACVVEQIGAWDSLKRSSALSKGTRGRVFMLYLMVAVLGWMLSLAVTLIVTLVLAMIPGNSSPQRAQTAGMIVIFSYYASAFAVQALTKPVYGIALMLFYYDQRIRLEGFDIEWMMQQAGLVVPAPAPVAADAQPWVPVVSDGDALAVMVKGAPEPEQEQLIGGAMPESAVEEAQRASTEEQA